MKETNDPAHSGGSPLFHPWQDTPGARYTVALLRGRNISTQTETPLWTLSDEKASSLFEIVTKYSLMLLVHDILALPCINELLSIPGATPYLTRTGGIPAMSLKRGRKQGFLVNASTWKWEKELSPRLVQSLVGIFKTTGYQATTPASLSEKIFRATLPKDTKISIPSQALRKDLLENNVGGRIDSAAPGYYLFRNGI